MTDETPQLIKVTIHWEETCTYESTIEVDANDVRAKGYDPDEPDDIQGYLEDGDESLWFEQCNTDGDFQGSDDRNINDTELTN